MLWIHGATVILTRPSHDSPGYVHDNTGNLLVLLLIGITTLLLQRLADAMRVFFL
jgi:hypothetical protein